MIETPKIDENFSEAANNFQFGIEQKEKPTHNNEIAILQISSKSKKSTLDKIIQANIETIKSKDNLFIFRKGNNLSLDIISYITKKILSINPNIYIFIDQEGGKINRFLPFDKKNSFNNYLKTHKTLANKFNLLDNKTKKVIKEQFNGRNTFISLKAIGEIYNNIGKKGGDFLDFISYFELLTIKKAGINTFGLVVDLDYGNPAISGLERSFSANNNDYMLLGNYFIKNAHDLGIKLYLKHFPGHGAGNTDTHDGVLSYSKEDCKYLEKNLEIFFEIIKKAKQSGSEIGLLVGHIFVPKNFKEDFDFILGQADFVLSDDMGMGGNNILSENPIKGNFFTTKELEKSKIKEKVIFVDSKINKIT